MALAGRAVAAARPGQGADRTPRWHDAIKGGSARLARIIDGLFENAFVKVADLPERLGVTYPTAKADADRLLDAGILRELTDTSPRTLYAHELFAVAFMEPDGAPSVDR